MTTPLVLYGTTVVSAVLTTANKMATTTGGTSTSKTTTCTDTTGTHFWYMEVLSQGGSNGDVATLPAPTAHGYFYDTSLAGNTIPAGNWSAVVRLNDTSGFASVDLIIRAYIYNSTAHTYTAISSMQVTHVALTATSTNYTIANTAFPGASFATNEFLYLDFFVFANGSGGHWNGDPIVSFSSSVATGGIANQFVVTTPGFNPSTSVNTVSVSEQNDLTEPISAQDNVTLQESNVNPEVLASLLLQRISEDNAASEIAFQAIKTSIQESNAQTETVTTNTLGKVIVTESNDVVENSIQRLALTLTESNDQAETAKGGALTRFSEDNPVSESVRAIPIQLVLISEQNDTRETTTSQSNTNFVENADQVETAAGRIALRIVESNDTSESLALSTLAPIGVDTTVQMLYDTVRAQYQRVRSSTTNVSIQLIAMVFFPPPVILSEHSVPGELDVLLIGEVYSQMHILKTIDDVSTFLLAYP